MCLIAYSPKGKMIPRDVLSHAYNQNGDGVGVMSIDGINKYLGKKALKRARRYIEKVLVPQNIAYAVHFRWATHGDVILKNVHPYETPDGNHWVMHNGVLGLTTAESSAEESDTAVYVRKYLDEELPEFSSLRYTQIETQIGWSNKFLIMDNEGNFKILNEGAGTWIDGNWYSNTYSLPAAFIPNRWPMTNYSRGHGRSGEDYYPLGSLGNGPYKDTYYSGRREYPSTKLQEPVHPLLEVTPINGGWTSEDRAAYYEALEEGMTWQEAEDYVDNGHKTLDHDDDGIAVVTVPMSDAGELAAIRAIANTQKEEAPIGGDFPPFEAEDDDTEEDGVKFRTYLKRFAQTVYNA